MPVKIASARRAGVAVATAVLAGLLAIAGCAPSAGNPSSAAEPEPGERFVQPIAGTDVSLTLMPIPGGSMAVSADDDLSVDIEPFWISRTEVTWDLFDVFRFQFDEGKTGETIEPDGVTRPSKPYISMDRGFGYSGYPAISMSYHAAKRFCEWLSEKTGRHYRLPTEIEWRYVCQRSGIDPADPGTFAWFIDNAEFKTHPVGSRKADALGVCDLYGNAAEWCISPDGKGVTYGGSYRDAIDRIGYASRVVRIYDWNASDPQFPQSIWWMADAGFVGFRIVLVEDNQEEAE
ncbi:MAG: formylglycine-generating enzyme family protein [Phycisphaerales bacterium]|nr:formylglycine-generating enzyme family protein [Phycisphaerales bacterium]